MAIDRGSTVLIEVEFKRKTAFATTYSYFDPTSPKVTVHDPVGTAVVDDQALTQSATGKYYYIVQSATNWAQGAYSATVTGTDGSYTEVDVTPAVFELE